ncbi:unnamed protein product, partial [Penicillium bialowiezense]
HQIHTIYHVCSLGTCQRACTDSNGDSINVQSAASDFTGSSTQYQSAVSGFPGAVIHGHDLVSDRSPVKALLKLDNRVAIWNLFDEVTGAPEGTSASRATEESLESVRQTFQGLDLGPGSDISAHSELDFRGEGDPSDEGSSTPNSLSFSTTELGTFSQPIFTMVGYKIKTFDGSQQRYDAAEEFV